MDPDVDGHRLLLPFDRADPEFAYGFELGRVWQVLRDRPGDEVVETVHLRNAEMLLRLAEATGRVVQTTELDETWVEATFAAADAVESTL